MPRISSAVLQWARETAGLSVDEAARKVGFKDGKRATAVEQLRNIEEGQKEPTRPQLLKFATAYRRPLITFYLAAPPAKAKAIEDYRSLPDPVRPRADHHLEVLVRDVRARQELVKDLIDDGDAERIRWVGSVKLTAGVPAIRDTLTNAIGWSLASYRACANAEKAFDYLRQQAERSGVYVLLIGNLGSHQTAFDVETFRGFALADKLAPFVVVNDQDARPAWSFTLLHELAHIALGVSGVSGVRLEGDVELLCNNVASTMLVPTEDIATLNVAGMAAQDVKGAITEFARPRRVSRALVTYRLFQAGRITQQLWQTLTDEYADEYRKSRAAEKEKNKEKDSTGPNYYVVKRHRLGPALLTVVGRGIEEGTITPTRAGKVLGVKPRNVAALLSGRAS